METGRRGPLRSIRRIPATLTTLFSMRSVVSGLSSRSVTILHWGNVASVICILWGCLYTLCNCLDRLLECIELAERVLVDLRGLFGAEHLGTCIKAACCNDTGHTDTGCVPGNDVVTVESAGAAATVDRVAEEREPDCDTHGTTEVGAWEAGF